MKEIRFISILLVTVLFCALLAPFNMAVLASEEAAFPAVDEPMPKDNKLKQGDFDTEKCLPNWYTNNQALRHVSADNGGYLKIINIAYPSLGYKLNYPGISINAGSYKFTGYFRMLHEGELTELRLSLSDGKRTVTNYVYPTSDEWLKVEFYIRLIDKFDSITVSNGSDDRFYQEYCIDNFSLVPVDSIPEGYVMPKIYGSKITAEQAEASTTASFVPMYEWDPDAQAEYEVKGLIINRDCDFIGTAASATKEGLEEYARSFAGTHITDFMINVFCQVAVYPSEVSTDFVDQYYERTANGTSPNNNHRVAHKTFIEDGIDFIDIWCETFPEVGINPWLSFRMNDAHPTTQGSDDLQRSNPEIRRVQHGMTSNSYYDGLMDYTHDVVRDFMLRLINESLSRYDCYGIELDWQRDIWLWYTGGEYNGLDILNDFMREVDALTKIYEEKYGHEIKIAVRVASELETNYYLGLDVMTWASEDIIDLIIPTARWYTTDFDVPVNIWASVMHPYGVEVAPGFEQRIVAGDSTEYAYHSLETLSAAAANWFAQGADKIYGYNYFRSYTGIIKPTERMSFTDEITANGSVGYWNVITTIGSPDKLMTLNRRMLVTENDIYPAWRGSIKQLPKTIAANTTGTIRVAIGKIPEGATVTLKFSVNTANENTPPSVHVGSREMVYSGSTYCHQGNHTKSMLHTYTIPADLLESGILIADITPEKNLTITYAEVYVDVSD